MQAGATIVLDGRDRAKLDAAAAALRAEGGRIDILPFDASGPRFLYGEDLHPAENVAKNGGGASLDRY